MRIFYSIEQRKQTRYFPTGLIGQISFSRLVEVMRRGGELRYDETITDIAFDPDEGVLQYHIGHRP